MDRLIRDYRKSDNQGLADMWNQSQSAWPTGFGGNVAYTAERIANDMKKQQALFYLVAEDRGKIAGYCWVSSYPKEPDACYVALLNAHPDYHGQGIGKGLLLESIRRAVKLGYYRVDLHTWPSNIKAVPLYKKTGFFWLPETQVHMQNYIPAALGHPLCRDFFASHDWYSSFVRKLDQEPDEIKIGKRRVFPYRFQAGDEFVEVTFDMESRRVCAVETNRAKARLVLDEPEVVVGRRQRVEVRCESVKGGKIEAEWLSTKSKKLALKPAGRAAELMVDPEVEAPEEHMPAMSVGVRVKIGGLSFKLEAGIRPKQPVDLEWHPRYPEFSARERVPLRLTMANNTGKKARASLEVKHRKDVRAIVHHVFRPVEKDGKTGCLVDTAKKSKGMGELRVRAKVKAGREALSTKIYRVPLLNIGHGQRPVLWHGERRSVWDTPGFLAEVERRGGAIHLLEKHGGRRLSIIESVLGPPFWPSEFANIEHRVTSRGASLMVSALSHQVPGLRFDRVLTLSGENAIEVRHRVFNGSKGSGHYQIRLSVWGGGDTPRARRVIPLREGIVGISGPNPFGGLGQELPQKPEDYMENWWANEDGGMVAGVVWEKADKIDYPSLELGLGRVDPGATAEPPPVHLVFGPGDHVLARRRFLQNVKGQSPEDYRRIEVVPRVAAAFEPPALFLSEGGRQPRTLVARNLSIQEMTADLSVRLPDGNEHRAFSNSVKLGRDFRKEIALNWARTGPAIGTITGTIGLYPIEGRFGIIPMSEAAPLEIVQTEEQGKVVWTIDNGLCRFKASPQFLGSIYSWVFQGREQILSSFPEPGNFSWERPWYGGIAPTIHPDNGWGRNLLIKERFYAKKTQARGASGLVWKGVEMGCRCTDRRTKGLRVKVSYLTLPGCPVMVIITSFKNATSGYMHFGSEAVGFVCPGGEHRGTRLRWDECGRERAYLRGDKGAWADSERWGAAENPENGGTITIAVPGGQSNQAVLLMDYGRDGGHLGQAMDIRLRAGETRSYLAFWGVAGCPEESLAFRHLDELNELP